LETDGIREEKLAAVSEEVEKTQQESANQTDVSFT